MIPEVNPSKIADELWQVIWNSNNQIQYGLEDNPYENSFGKDMLIKLVFDPVGGLLKAYADLMTEKVISVPITPIIGQTVGCPICDR